MSSTTIEPWLREILRCPVGLHELIDATGPDGAAELQCAADCGGPGQRRGYRIDGGVPVLLADESRVFTV
ncbi:Trm112 family protein [Flexivirga sp.]|uniref:Trm112 family protein n=1 Tax=Flexivirga sp. TaxID=1962927 RepID=UPI003F7EA4C8